MNRRDELDLAIDALRRRHRERPSGLTAEGRGRVLAAALESGGARRNAARSRWAPAVLAVAAAAAVVALSLPVVLGPPEGPAAGGPAGDAVRVQATKVGDDVVFVLANGGTSHRVTRSAVPHSFDTGATVTVRDGSYRDAMRSDDRLVFYRID